MLICLECIKYGTKIVNTHCAKKKTTNEQTICVHSDLYIQPTQLVDKLSTFNFPKNRIINTATNEQMETGKKTIYLHATGEKKTYLEGNYEIVSWFFSRHSYFGKKIILQHIHTRLT